MKKSVAVAFQGVLKATTSRRRFLQYSGASVVSAGLLLTGCSDDDGVILDVKGPTKLTAVQNEVGDVLLSWQNNAAPVDGLVVQRATSVAGPFKQLGDPLPPTTSSYTDYAAKLPKAGSIYFYRVAAFIGEQSSRATEVVKSMGGAALIYAGRGDTGILNYLYALEQLQVAFYARMVGDSKFSTTFSVAEQRLFQELLQHETAHRAFFKALLGSEAITEIEVDFSTVNFETPAGVFATARTLKNLIVGAYNGAAMLFSNKEYVLLTAKIVSVEARHGVVVGNLVNPGATEFGATANRNGLDPASTPAEVLVAVDPFIVTRLDIKDLPTA